MLCNKTPILRYHILYREEPQDEPACALASGRFMLNSHWFYHNLIKHPHIVSKKNSIRYIFDILDSKSLGDIADRRDPY